jgi:membrane-associated phospholipid phosphatase
MSVRMFAALGMLVGIIGCQAVNRTAPTSADLDHRLARIEQDRLARECEPPAIHPAERHRPSENARSIDEFSTASAAPAGELALADCRDWSSDARHWALADMGDDARDSTDLTDRETISFRTADGGEGQRRPPLDSLWETIKRDVKDMPGDLWSDTKRVYANPLNLVILGTAYGGSLALQETGPDDTVEDHYRPGHHTFSSGWRNTFDAVGNPGTHFAVAGAWYLLGQQTKNDKTYEVGKTLASALIINDLTVLLGQAATWDRAPNGEWGTFPSGHTSSSFCIASVMDQAYGHVVGVPLYGLATLVAMERVDDRNHYFSDVVMGAVIGTVIGHSVASGRDPEFFGWKILPYADPSGASGVAFLKTLD